MDALTILLHVAHCYLQVILKRVKAVEDTIME